MKQRRMASGGLMLALLTSITALTACGGRQAPEEVATPAAAATESPSGTLKALQNGDRACYVILEVAGAEQSLEGDFELCGGGPNDATALIGRVVTVVTEKANVLAASCQGDVDCGKSDQVDLVVRIVAVP